MAHPLPPLLTPILFYQAMLPNLPEMVSDEESQKTARKSALLVARLRDGSFRADVLVNLDENGSGYTSKNMFENCKSDIEFVQVQICWQSCLNA